MASTRDASEYTSLFSLAVFPERISLNRSKFHPVFLRFIFITEPDMHDISYQ